MNLIFVDQQQPVLKLDAHTPQAKHILEVLRLGVGNCCYVGIPQGPKGLATLESIHERGVTLKVLWQENQCHLYPIELLVGLPRPQTARKILNTVSTLGIAAIHFFESYKGEPAYGKSSLWHTHEWQTHLHLGAQQAFATDYPVVTHTPSLEALLNQCTCPSHRLALDVYESCKTLGAYALQDATKIYLAVGPERGWSALERTQLQAHRFCLAHMGPRVQRVESAVLTALGWILAQGGFWA